MKSSLLYKWIATATLALATALGAMAQSASFATTTTNYDSAGGSVTFTVTVDIQPSSMAAMGMNFTLPAGWSFGSTVFSQFRPDVRPGSGETGTIGYAYTDFSEITPSSSFQFVLNYPAGLSGAQTIPGNFLYTVTGSPAQTVAMTAVTIEGQPAAPTISAQPQGATVNEGADASFSVTAAGSPTPTYQWKKDGVDIPDATSSTLSITGVTPANAGSYTVVVTNNQGSVTSSAAVLTVNAAPAITTQPVSATVNEGGSHTFSVVATGASPLTYQWRSSPSGAALDGETNSTLQIANVSPSMAGSFYVEVSNAVASVNSEVVTLTVVEKPVITAAPASQTVTVGGSVAFSFAASGTEPLAIQWFKGESPISGATGTTFSIPMVAIADAGSYFVQVTNAAGSATSSPAAVLTVEYAPVITVQPANQTSGVNGTVNFSVTANAVPAIPSTGYQWYSVPAGGSVGTMIPNATAPTLSLASVQSSENGTGYYVEITNSVGTTTSSTATLTVNESPAFTAHPQNVTVTEGGNASFMATVTGNPTPTLQWQFSPSAATPPADIPGETSATLSLTGVTRSQSGSYQLVATNEFGSGTSTPATLDVQFGVEITVDLADIAAGVGESVTLSVEGVSNPEVTSYQWYRGGELIPGATNADLVLSNLQLSDSGATFYLIASNGIGEPAQSRTATLTVNEKPVITTQPENVTVTEGASASFTIAFTGNPTPTFQWMFKGVAIDGATASTYTIAATTRAQAGAYTVMATNEFGSATSSPATLDVQFRPEITTDLADVAAGVGETVTLSVEGVSNPDVTSYQWYRDGEMIPGATNEDLVLTGLQLSDSGATFYLIASNGIGDPVRSRTATLTVNEKPVVTSQPTDVTVLEGEPASFAISFTGNPTPSFQWMLNGEPIAGATGPSYDISAAVRTQSGAYTVMATNEFGSATSTPAKLDVQFAPEITTDLVDQTVAVGSTVTFAPIGDANPEPTFQWYRDGSPVSGVTIGELVLTNVQLSDSGSTFYLEASNGIGAVVKTATVTLTVQQPVAITLQPEGATLDAGASHTFMVEATGDPAPTYQWRKNGANIAGATDSSYVISSATGTDAATYTVAVTNPQGTVVSSGAVIVVNLPPSITTQPVGATKVVGGTHTFTVAATGAATLTYQWKKDGANISGATSSTLVLETLAVEDGGEYTVTVTNRLGSATSNPVTLTVDKALKTPSITTQPRNTSARTGGDATFTVEADGNPLPTYQWRKNGVAISGATSSSLVITNAQSADAGGYDVVVSNSQGSASSNLVRLTVTAADVAPVITSQPRDRTVAQDTAVTFAVVATGLPAPTYQWRKNGVAITGATGETYSIPAAAVNDGGTYSVVVTNAAGTVTSRNATLVVLSKVYAGTYFGSFGEGRGSFAIVVRPDNTGTFLGFDAGTNLYISGTVVVDVDGNFELTVTSEAATPSGERSIGADRSNQIVVIGTPDVGAATVSLIGSIKENGEVLGTVTGVAGLSMSGAREEGSATEEVSGFYEANAGGSDAVTLTIVSPTGKALVLTKSADGAVDAGVGTASSTGAIEVTTVKNNTVSATVSATTSTIAAEVTDSTGATTSFTGGNDEVIATQRLVNISTRARAGTGVEQTIAGLVITGQDSKPVLIRAIGPGLSAFGVNGVLAAPKLELMSGQTVIASNTGWSTSANAAEITAAAASAGAFALSSANADSAILETLAPGSYTAMAGGADGGTGVVLIEVYDLSTPTPGQKLFNISTRAAVGSGDSIAVAGFVVSGSVPKRVLLRGIGPGLSQFGLTGVLADPQISVVRNGTQVASNDDWSVNAAAVTEAGTAAGAFALTSGSKDAAMVISLEPGVYTLQLSGVAGATGIGLIEVYEVP